MTTPLAILFDFAEARYWARQMKEGKTEAQGLMREFGKSNALVVILYNEGGVDYVKRQFPHWPDIRTAMYPSYRFPWDLELLDYPADTTADDLSPVEEVVGQDSNLKRKVADRHSRESLKKRRSEDAERGQRSPESHGWTTCVGNEHHDSLQA